MLEWAFRRVAGKAKVFWACMRRGGLHGLDQAGKGASATYIPLREHQIRSYVQLITQFNNLFQVGPLNRATGAKPGPYWGFPLGPAV